MTADVNVVLLDFKTTKGKEMVATNEDGSYTIFINSRLSDVSQLEAYQHAMRHIENRDFEKNDVQQIEYEAHNLPDVQQGKRLSSIDIEERSRRTKRKRAAIQRKLREYEKKMQWLRETDPVRYARRIEHQYLYGDDY